MLSCHIAKAPVQTSVFIVDDKTLFMSSCLVEYGNLTTLHKKGKGSAFLLP